jgi:hypothetical protein
MKRFLPPALVAGLLLALCVPVSDAQRGTGSVCGDPTVRCRTGDLVFQPHDLPFRLPPRAVIWESEQFYAVVLRSMRVADEYGECERFIPEAERLEAQTLFPRHKVFASRCTEPGELYYTNTDPKTRFIAVYAGRTRAEADRLLAKVKNTGKYPGPNLRRIRAGFNGT